MLELDKSLPSLVDCAELLYQDTFGCIGLVRAWLYHASVLTATRQKKFDLALIKATMKAPMQLYSIADEILTGEVTLGISPCSAFKSAVEAEAPRIPTDKKRKPGAKPFQRKAKRFEAENRV